MPVNETLCGLPPASSLKSRDAPRAPIAEGVNVTWTEQLAPGPSVLPHVVTSEKSDAFGPEMAICQTFIVVLPTLVNVTT